MTDGSARGGLHLVAIAQAAGITLTWNDISELSAIVPLLARIYPNGSADVNHFHAAGGLGFTIAALLDAGLLHEDVQTVVGPGLRHYTQEPKLDGDGVMWLDGTTMSHDTSVLRGVEDPFDTDGGLKTLAGNLGSCVIKTSAVKRCSDRSSRTSTRGAVRTRLGHRPRRDQQRRHFSRRQPAHRRGTPGETHRGVRRHGSRCDRTRQGPHPRRTTQLPADIRRRVRRLGRSAHAVGPNRIDTALARTGFRIRQRRSGVREDRDRGVASVALVAVICPVAGPGNHPRALAIAVEACRRRLEHRVRHGYGSSRP